MLKSAKTAFSTKVTLQTMHGNEKGIVLRLEHGEGEIHIHPDTLMRYLRQIPKSGKGWVRLRARINVNPDSTASHHLMPLKPRLKNTA